LAKIKTDFLKCNGFEFFPIAAAFIAGSMVARGGYTALGFVYSMELGIGIVHISFVYQVQLEVASLGCYGHCSLVIVAWPRIAKLLARLGVSVAEFDECCTLSHLGYAITANHKIESARFKLKTVAFNGAVMCGYSSWLGLIGRHAGLVVCINLCLGFQYVGLGIGLCAGVFFMVREWCVHRWENIHTWLHSGFIDVRIDPVAQWQFVGRTA
jgi:hypothetical protein